MVFKTVSYINKIRQNKFNGANFEFTRNRKRATKTSGLCFKDLCIGLFLAVKSSCNKTVTIEMSSKIYI